MRRICATAALAAVLVCGVVGRPALAQESLAWKLAPGDIFYLESATQTNQAITTGGETTKQSSTITTTSSFRVVKKDADQVVLEQKILGVKVEPESDPTANAAGRFANLLKGLTLTVTMRPSGQDLAVSGYANWLRTISGGNEATERQLRSQMLPEENLRQDLAQVFSMLPDKPVAPGATWTREETLQLGPRGTVKGEATFRFEGKTDKGDRITVTRSLTYAPVVKEDKTADKPKSAANIPSPAFDINEVKMGKANGEYLFDAARGRLVEGTLNTDLEGTLTVAKAERGNSIVVVKQSTRRTLRLSDKKAEKDKPPKS